MSGPDNPAENFLRRWSRRKRAARPPVREAGKPVPADAEPRPAPGAAPGEAARPAFDPASLPPLESITAASDVRAFLAPDVPGEISRAALRRAWVTDPAIRDFVGLAENQWDFTKPDGVPGFGALDLTPELRRMVANLFGSAPTGTETAPAQVIQAIGKPGEAISALTPTASDNAADTRSEMPARAVAHPSAPDETPAQAAAGPDPVGLTDGAADAAPQRGSRATDELLKSPRRRHGRAVPE